MRITPRLPQAVAPRAEPQEPPFLASDSADAGLSMQQMFSIAWANRKMTIIITVVLIALSVLIIKLLPKTYVSTATIVVEYEVNDPLGDQEFPVMLMDNYITTQIQLMRSSEVLVPVVVKLGLTKSEDFTAGYNGSGTLEDWAKAQLLKRLTIAHNSGTQLIYVTADSKSAAEAALIANTLAETYIGQQTLRLNQPASFRAQRYAEQLKELQEKVNVAQENVTRFRQSTGLTDVVATGNDAEVAALNGLELRYQEALNQMRATEISKVNEQDVSRALGTSQVIQNLRGQLATQQAQMAEYQTTYGPQHPRVVELQSQIESTKKSLDAELRVVTNSSSIELSSSRDMVAKLKSALDAQRVKVLTLRRQQDDGAKYLLELESAQAVYRQSLDSYDKIIATAGGKYSNVSIMSPAEVPVKSTKPNKLKLLVLALGASGGAGVVIPFLLELLFARRIRCRDDMERDLMVPVLSEFKPVLAAIPQVAR